MAYTYTNSRDRTYILHEKLVALKSGNTQTIYFFATTTREGARDRIPAGYEVSETKNGLPVLKRVR